MTNLSTVSDVKEEVQNFTQRGSDSTSLGGKLALTMTGYAGNNLLTGLFPRTYPPSKLLKENLPQKADGSNSNVLEFSIGGNWSGAFDAELYSLFDMTQQFTALPKAN